MDENPNILIVNFLPLIKFSPTFISAYSFEPYFANSNIEEGKLLRGCSISKLLFVSNLLEVTVSSLAMVVLLFTNSKVTNASKFD